MLAPVPLNQPLSTDLWRHGRKGSFCSVIFYGILTKTWHKRFITTSRTCVTLWKQGILCLFLKHWHSLVLKCAQQVCFIFLLWRKLSTEIFWESQNIRHMQMHTVKGVLIPFFHDIQLIMCCFNYERGIKAGLSLQWALVMWKLLIHILVKIWKHSKISVSFCRCKLNVSDIQCIMKAITFHLHIFRVVLYHFIPQKYVYFYAQIPPFSVFTGYGNLTKCKTVETSLNLGKVQ